MRVALLALSLLTCACTTAPKSSIPRDPVGKPSREDAESVMLRGRLGMERDLDDLGYQEKQFDSCRMKVKDEKKCGTRYLSVLNFRLQCRDSEDTVDQVVVNMKPLVADKVEWRVGELRGFTKTDAQGFGQLQVVTAQPAGSERLVLVVGKQFLGLEIQTATQVVLPRYWCRDH